MTAGKSVLDGEDIPDIAAAISVLDQMLVKRLKETI